MQTAVITGANRGIGLQTATELAGKGLRVFLGTRNPEVNAQAVKDIEGDARWLTIDVTNPDSIKAAAESVAELTECIDVLINNAAIYTDKSTSIVEISREKMAETFHANTFGPIEVTQAFLPLLRKSNAARVINVSSGYGQLDGLSADVPSYCLSKLTLNGVTLMQAAKLKDDNIAVNSVCPGWVRTDMGGSDAPRSIEEGAAGIVWLATEAPHETTGKFFRDGNEIPW
jgi:NAD(P)-dependent dehydrogenase (short-subunit alcohol dehydrogenase family)